MVVLVPTGRWLVERWETDVWSDVCTCCTAREAREWRYWLVERGCERVRIRRLGQNRYYLDCRGGLEAPDGWTFIISRDVPVLLLNIIGGRFCQFYPVLLADYRARLGRLKNQVSRLTAAVNDPSADVSDILTWVRAPALMKKLQPSRWRNRVREEAERYRSVIAEEIGDYEKAVSDLEAKLPDLARFYDEWAAWLTGLGYVAAREVPEIQDARVA